MISAHCAGGVTLVGESLQAIARREFGDTAFYRDRQNPNDIALGQILRPGRNPREYWICATVLQIEVIS